MSTVQKLASALCVCAALASEGVNSAAPTQPGPVVLDCGDPFVNSYGPFDYRTATAAQRNIVESHHFTSDVEALRSGKSATIGGDLDYTLRAFPNHVRALTAMIRLGQREKTASPKGANYPVACYVERAIRYRPDDLAVRQVRGIYLASEGRYPEAIQDLVAVVAQQPDNASARYNLGLAYFETKQYDLAIEEAKRAKDLGFPLDGLIKKLTSAGRWPK